MVEGGGLNSFIITDFVNIDSLNHCPIRRTNDNCDPWINRMACLANDKIICQTFVFAIGSEQIDDVREKPGTKAGAQTGPGMS